MLIKKSAVFSILLALGSVCSLVFTSYRGEPSFARPAITKPVKCCKRSNRNKIPMQWNIITSNKFQLEG